MARAKQLKFDRNPRMTLRDNCHTDDEPTDGRWTTDTFHELFMLLCRGPGAEANKMFIPLDQTR